MKKISDLNVTKSNQLIEAQYSRGLIETRIVDACIAQIHYLKDVTPERFFELRAADLFELNELGDADSVYQQLKVAAENLINQKLLFKESTTWINWFGSVSVPPGEGKIILRFSVDIKPYLFALKGNFTTYKQENTLKFKCSYSHRIYEFLVQWLPVGKKDFSLDELKTRLDLENEYARIDDFKRRVIDPALKEINKHTNIWVKCVNKKSGRTITHLCFTFGPKISKQPKLPKDPPTKYDPGKSYSDARINETPFDYCKRTGLAMKAMGHGFFLITDGKAFLEYIHECIQPIKALIKPMNLAEILRRRTFAIISHPNLCI